MILLLRISLFALLSTVFLGLVNNSKLKSIDTDSNAMLFGIGTEHINKLTWQQQEETQFYLVQKSEDGKTTWKEIMRIQTNDQSDSTDKIISVKDFEPSDIGFYRVISIKAKHAIYSNRIEINREKHNKTKDIQA